jgi:IclR family acetate operon transcriptional repressor
MNPESHLVELKSGSSSDIRLLARVAAVLRVFSGPRQSWKASEIGAATGLSKATAHRIIQNLCTEDLLQRAKDGSYHLGPLACALGARAVGPAAMRSRGRPVLQQLTELTGETAVMFQLSVAGNSITCIEQIESPHGLRLVATVGERLPLHVGGSSRAILAFLTDAQVDAALAPLSSAEAKRARKQIALTREQGFTLSLAETNDGVGGIAAPVLDPAGNVIGSIAVIGPLNRMDQQHMTALAPAVMQAAAVIGGARTETAQHPSQTSGGT